MSMEIVHAGIVVVTIVRRKRTDGKIRGNLKSRDRRLDGRLEKYGAFKSLLLTLKDEDRITYQNILRFDF